MSRTSNDTVVTLQGFVRGSTDMAILFEVHTIAETPVADPEKQWFPLSQVKRSVRQPKNSQEMDTLVVTEWIAKKKGFI